MRFVFAEKKLPAALLQNEKSSSIEALHLFVRSFVWHVTTFVVLKYIISSTEVRVYLAAIHVLPSHSLSLYSCTSNVCDIVCKQNAFVFCMMLLQFWGKNFCELAVQNGKQLKKTLFISLKMIFSVNTVHCGIKFSCMFFYYLTFINELMYIRICI